MSDHRTCKRCKQDLPIGFFRQQSARPGLHFWTCYDCDNARSKAKRSILAAIRPPKERPTEKRCTGCAVIQPVTAFNTTHGGRPRPKCKSCQSDDYRDYVSRNRERVSRSKREGKYVARFGLNLDELDDLHRSVGDSCESCGVHRDSTPNGVLVLDHDHSCCPTERTCGQCIRGVLCTACNVALGALHDDPLRVVALLGYIAERTGLEVGNG